jgi:hypothetical protein
MADKLTPVVSNLIGRGLNWYARRKRRQARAEARREMIEAQAQAIDPSKFSASESRRSEPTREAQPGGGGIDRLQEQTDCTFCEALLEAARELPEPERTQAVAEYGRFQGALEGGDEAAVKTAMRETEVLAELVKEMRGIGQ